MSGGRLGRVRSDSDFSGIWTFAEVAARKLAGTWPVLGDPYFSSVTSLLHFNGTNGSTTYTDVTGLAWTGHAGSPTINTSQSVFGGASLRTSAGNYIRANTPGTAFAYGTGDFTWEGRVRLDSTSSVRYFIDHGTDLGRVIYNGGLRYANPSTGTGSVLYTAAPALSANTWYAIAVSRQSGTTRLFLDGTLVASGADSYNFGSNTMQLGATGNGFSGLDGYLDEWRITKGVARYTANYTPDTAEFQDS